MVSRKVLYQIIDENVELAYSNPSIEVCTELLLDYLNRLDLDKHTKNKITFLNSELPKIYLWAQRLNEKMEKDNIKIYSFLDKEYPFLLNQTADKPLLLYMQGQIKALQEYTYFLSVVGSRKMTFYGKKFINLEIARLMDYSVVIVSGLARGCDTEAHRTCLDNNGYTIACLAHGIDLCYPREHNAIKNRIRETGLLMSEFPLGVEPRKQFFPSRNRIISGLSQATLVVEAKAASGSLLTSERAGDQGRDVLALPGNIYEESSSGCNRLIRDGAYPILGAYDILDVLGIDWIEGKGLSKNPSLDPIISTLHKAPYSENELSKILRITVKDLRIRLIPYEAKGMIKREKGLITLTRF